jgi:hypothetical protein
MSHRADVRSVIRAVLREPTLHFLLLAGVLFAAERGPLAGRGNVVEVDRGELRARIQRIELESGVSLTEVERRSVEESYVGERVLFEEALAMGLEDDPRVVDVLVQKMMHVLSADVIQPTETELQAFYDENRGRYVPEPRVTLDELVIASSDPLPPSLAAQLRSGVDSAALETDLALVHNPISDVSLGSLTGAFGVGTASLIAAARPGEWVGPHHTVRGQHWFRVTERSAPGPEPLEVVRDQVRLDWITAEEEARLAERVRGLRGRYTVIFTGEGVEP